MKPEIKAFFDKATWTLTYVVFNSATRDAVVIDQFGIMILRLLRYLRNR